MRGARVNVTIRRPASPLTRNAKCRDCRYSRCGVWSLFQEQFRICKSPHVIGRDFGHSRAYAWAKIERENYQTLDVCGPRAVYFSPRRTIWQRIKNLWERDPQP